MSMARAQFLAASCLQEVRAGRNLSDVLAALWARENHSGGGGLSAAERGAVQDLAYGSLRHYGLLRQVLDDMVQKVPPAVSDLLIVALYQLAFTRNAPHAVVNEAVARAGKIAKGRFKNLVNAVLRRFLRERDALIQAACRVPQAKFNLPDWWLRVLKHSYPDDWEGIVQAAMKRPPLTLRVNRRHHTAQSYCGCLKEASIEARVLGDYAVMLAEPVPVQALPGFDEGWVSVQDWGAQQAVPLLNPRDGERVLDACAAPGGKTGHILEWADCSLTAMDVDGARLQRVADNLARLRLHAELVCAAAEDKSAWYDGQPFDAVLADVPCTASGVIKRHPDIKWLRRPQDAAQTAAQQHNLLDTLWTTLKPGGRMLLATCSIFEEENRHQMQAFVRRHRDAAVRGHRILLPNDNQDGFFYALIDKTA